MQIVLFVFYLGLHQGNPFFGIRHMDWKHLFLTFSLLWCHADMFHG